MSVSLPPLCLFRRLSFNVWVHIELSAYQVWTFVMNRTRVCRFAFSSSYFGRFDSYLVSGVGSVMAMCFYLGRWTRWLEKCAANLAKGSDSISSAIPFAAAIRYRYNNSECGSIDIKPRALVMTGKKHCVLGTIVRLSATRISPPRSHSVLSFRCSGLGV